MPRDGAKPWGPVTVICNSLSTEQEYCRLVLQIQYVSFEDTFINPQSVVQSKEPSLLSLRFLGVKLAVTVSTTHSPLEVEVVGQGHYNRSV